MTQTTHSISSLAQKCPTKPFFAFREHTLIKAAQCFTENFNAAILYAVKTNPEPHILTTLYKQGIQTFDVASIDEIKQVKRLIPNAQLFYMHPVKSRQAIKEAYFDHQVKHFSLDSEDELRKILQETNNAKDLNLHVRLSIPNTFSELDLSEKFGIGPQEAPKLLAQTKKHAHKLGLCFHVGSQCMHPDAYRIAIRIAKEVIDKSNINIDYFNVGGGFPSIYPGMIPPKPQEYFDCIHQTFAELPNHKNIQLLSEPGRALVAESTSLVVRVDLRKDKKLYINDGTYGSLFDAGTPKFIFPVKMLRTRLSQATSLTPFSFYGPTCDTLDFMKGPFYLPEDIQEGDLIEIGQMGAYAKTMATRFNGFGHEESIYYVNDDPLMTLYDTEISHEKLEVIAA